MPTVTITWTLSVPDLNTLVPPLVRRINQLQDTQHPQPPDIPTLEAILKPFVGKHLKKLAKEEHVGSNVDAIRIDLENEIDAIVLE